LEHRFERDRRLSCSVVRGVFPFMHPFNLPKFFQGSLRKTLVVAAVLGAWLTVMPAGAQEAGVKEPGVKPVRPRIGLVLEGGGALGFAHIGVIEWMEAHHIPVDYVAGTSMGGLVGGLYASGESPADIEDFVGGIHWSTVLGGELPYSALSFRRKEDKLAYPNRVELGLKRGLSVPEGLNSGSAVGLLLDRKMLPYYDLRNFNDLPIPFRCVATDMTAGGAYVFQDGSLAQAMRATMSIPGVFAPVQHNGHFYSDGGAVDNLPVDVAKKMGAQVIIAVYLDTGPFNPKSLSSLGGVVGRNLEIVIQANERESLKNANILLKANVAGFTSTDFEESAKIIPKGEEVAQEHAAELEKYALNDADWKAYVADRASRRRTKVPVPQFIEVYGMQGMQQAEVAREFAKYVGKPLDTTKLDGTIADLEGTGTYSSVSYNLIDKDGQTGLLVRPRTKNYAPPFLNVGGTLSSNDSNNIQLGLGARATFVDIAGAGSELRVEGMLGMVAGANGELYKPLFAGKSLFVAPHAYFSHTDVPFFTDGQQLEEFTQYRNGLGVDLGYDLNARAELRVGEDYQWFGEERTVGTPVAQEFKLTPLVSSVKFQYLGQDDVMVPTKGSIVQSQFSYYTQRPNASGGFSQMNTYTAHFFKLSDKSILFGTASGGTSFGATDLGLAGLSLGGPLRLSSYARGELLGTDYFLFQPGVLYRLTRLNPVIGGAVYATVFYEIGKVWGGASGTPTLPNDISGGFVAKTLFGPVYGGGSIGDSGHRKWFVGIGRVF
jgi:NTE family protein